MTKTLAGLPRAGLMALSTSMLVLLWGCAAAPWDEPLWSREDAHGNGSVVAFDAASAWFASGGLEGRIRLWRLPDGEPGRGWTGHRGPVMGLAFPGRDRSLLSVGWDGTLALWRSPGVLARRVVTGTPVTALAIDRESGRAVTGHDDGSVRWWSLPGLDELDRARIHRASVRATAIQAGGTTAASSADDGTVMLRSLRGAPRALAEPPTDAWSLVFSADGRYLFGGGWFDLYRWTLDEPGDDGLRLLPTEHHGIIAALDVLPDGGLASISRQTDSAVYILDPESGDSRRRFRRHDLCGAAIRVSPDGRWLGTTSDDASVRLWRLDRAPSATARP